MGRWLSRLHQDEKNHETLKAVTDKTDVTPTQVGFDSFVSSSVTHTSKIRPETAGPPPEGYVSFVSPAFEPASVFSPPVAPVGNEGFVSSVSYPDERKQDFFVEPDRSGWDGEDWQTAYEERAATLEYDDGLPRQRAEALAREWVIAEIERATHREHEEQ